MKLLTLLCAFLLATGYGLAETRLAVTIRGNPAGYATLSQKIMPDGLKLVELRLELGNSGRKVQMRTEARYDAAGLPTRKFQEVSLNGVVQRQVTATFDKAGAHVVLIQEGKRTVKNVSLVPTAPRANLSEFWLIRDKPKPGQSEETYQFNLDTLEWEIVRTEYRGPKKLKMEDRVVDVHEVITSRGSKKATSYLDGQGLPVLVDQDEVKMVKLWPK